LLVECGYENKKNKKKNKNKKGQEQNQKHKNKKNSKKCLPVTVVDTPATGVGGLPTNQ